MTMRFLSAALLLALLLNLSALVGFSPVESNRTPNSESILLANEGEQAPAEDQEDKTRPGNSGAYLPVIAISMLIMLRSFAVSAKYRKKYMYRGYTSHRRTRRVADREYEAENRREKGPDD